MIPKSQPEYQKKRIGSTLVLSLLQMMKERGFSEGVVYSAVTEEEAIRMYEHLGFQIEKWQNCRAKILR